MERAGRRPCPFACYERLVRLILPAGEGYTRTNETIRPKEARRIPRTVDLLRRHGFHTKRRLGQNFLLDPNLLKRIATSAELTTADTVLEIGPGSGNLTRELAERAGNVVAVELDKGLQPILSEALAGYKNVHLVWGDFLKQDLAYLWGLVPPLPGGERKIVANVPYYISTPILVKILTSDAPPSLAVILLQQEVAERLTADPGSKAYGSLSVLAQYHAEPELVVKVPPGAFFPPPEVASAVVRLRFRAEPPVVVNDSAFLFRIVRASFGQRRKTILNSLNGSLGPELGREILSEALMRAGIDPRRRGETLSLMEFAALTRAIEIITANEGR